MFVFLFLSIKLYYICFNLFCSMRIHLGVYMQLIAAPQYFSRQSRRLLSIPDSVLSFCKRHSRVSFKKVRV